ncbi:hypothetical protein ACQEXU_14430 [Vibrio sp. TRT 21S02]|uniref:hypothetical protein n=1 Tax=Vibrio sp. TRT 21S02 TaxID=3418507 RepID=UPI003CF5CF8A
MSKYIMFIITVTFLFNSSAFAYCSNEKGYTFGYLNGVVTTLRTARQDMFRLYSMAKSGTSKDSEPLQLYNDTGGGLSTVEDFVETFDQRLRELNLTDSKSERWEIMWMMLDGQLKSPDGETTLFNQDTDSAIWHLLVADLRQDLSKLITAASTSLLQQFSSSPNTHEVRNKHKELLDDRILAGNGFVFVAHSQGNLWLNEAYNYVTDSYGYSDENVKVVHIAPASIQLNGEHHLNSKDLVIRILQESSLTPIASTFTMDFDGSNDWFGFGHGLNATYLSNLPPYPQIDVQSSMHRAFDEVTVPEWEDYMFEVEVKQNISRGGYTRHDYGFIDRMSVEERNNDPERSYYCDNTPDDLYLDEIDYIACDAGRFSESKSNERVLWDGYISTILTKETPIYLSSSSPAAGRHTYAWEHCHGEPVEYGSYLLAVDFVSENDFWFDATYEVTIRDFTGEVVAKSVAEATSQSHLLFFEMFPQRAKNKGGLEVESNLLFYPLPH